MDRLERPSGDLKWQESLSKGDKDHISIISQHLEHDDFKTNVLQLSGFANQTIDGFVKFESPLRCCVICSVHRALFFAGETNIPEYRFIRAKLGLFCFSTGILA